jgi:transcriptional regulator of acetoin/glycerol metabolism
MGSGAPIFSPDGSLLGGVSLIARYYNASPHIFGMAVAAAQAIENEFRTSSALLDCKKAFSDREVSYGYQKAVISSIPEALIAIDRNGCITMINENARKVFWPGCGVRGGKPHPTGLREGKQRFL